VLAAIRDDLKSGAPCRVVAASLVEAGVDLDFPLVLQGGGRARLDRSGARPLRALIENWRAPERQGALSRHEARLRGVGAQHGTRLAAAVAGPVVQRFPGHSDFRTTQRYVHLADDELQRAAEHLKL
jgi:integrase